MGISEKLVTDDKIAARRIFNSLLVFGRVAEHGLSCLIQYLKDFNASSQVVQYHYTSIAKEDMRRDQQCTVEQ